VYQYNMRLNAAGNFSLPATKIKTLYGHDYGYFPNNSMLVKP